MSDRINITRFLALFLLAAAGALIASGCERTGAASELPYSDPPDSIQRVAPVGGTPRFVLALIDSSEAGVLRTRNNIHEMVEFFLNHLGYGVTYLDLNTDPLPDDAAMQGYAAIVSWFSDDQTPDVRSYLAWLERNVRAGRKYVMIGNSGTLRDTRSGEAMALTEAGIPYALIGAEYLGNRTSDTSVLVVVSKDPDMVEYERGLDTSILGYEQVLSTDPANNVYLSIARADLEDSRSDVVFTSPTGAYVQQGYFHWQDPNGIRRLLRIEPFRFFEEVLVSDTWPRPDVTTLYGGRLMYSQIDGDGLRSAYEPDLNIFGTDKIKEEVLQKYPYLFTSSVIVFDVDIGLLGSPRIKRLARSIFELENVEVASHTWAHPFDWRGDLSAERQGIESEVFEGYPNTVVEALEKEILDSIEYINKNLAPRGKPVRVLLWSGAANPDGRAVDLADEAGVFNLNGGLGRYDNELDSVSWLKPFVGQPQGRIQYYATFANDNNFTGLWTGPFAGFANLIQDLERTDRDRRLTPINVYFHFYSGTKDASLRGLTDVLDWTGTQDINSIWASEYVATVQGFLTAEIHPVTEGVWDLRNYGKLRTFRLEGSQRIDLTRSENVVGYRHVHGSTYVALGSEQMARIALAADADSSSSYVEYCGCLVQSRATADGGESYEILARVSARLTLAGVDEGQVVEVTPEGGNAEFALPDLAGRVTVPLSRGIYNVTVAYPQAEGQR